jgi:signal transduction histidine kinase
MAETVFDELKRYVGFDADDEAALRALHPVAQPHFKQIAKVFYDRILGHQEARTALEGGESQVGRLKVTLVGWMELLLSGPWDNNYFETRCRIGRLHVRIALPQHYMFGAMNVVREEFERIIDDEYASRLPELHAARSAVGKILDIELAIMLHTYREDLLAQQARAERLATFGQLVGSIGHELRNPLGVIETSLFILKNRLGEDERAKKHVERIGEQLGISNRIISDLLDLIRDKPLTQETVNFARMLKSVEDSIPGLGGVTVRSEGMDALPEIQGDAVQLRQVLLNLVQNAVDAAQPSGRVTVSGRSKPGTIEIAVADTGPGIAPEVRKRIFEPLITTKVKGIGLGLALVKRIVERHRGTIGFESEPGEGTVFTIRLPAA